MHAGRCLCGSRKRGRVCCAHPETDIAGIVAAVNEGEIQQGNAASAKATSADVVAFAQMMVADHTAALSNGQAVFARNDITPGENDTTRTLRANSQLTVTNLNTYTGTAFDRTYMQTQRGSVAAHLDRARQILGSLR